MAVISTETYTVVAHRAEEGGFWGEVLELPGCVSQGETEDELRHNMLEAIAAVLESNDPEVPHIEIQVDPSAPEIDAWVDYQQHQETWTAAH